MDEVIPLILSGADGEQSRGTINIYYWTKKRARRRGIFVCAAIYFVGILATLSPAVIIHFIIPPIWILIGPWVAIKVIRTYEGSREFRRGRSECPNCRVPVKFIGFKEEWPVVFQCKSCGKQVSAAPVGDDLRGIPLNAERY